MTQDGFDDAGRYIIPDYHRARPFSSFLPGIAGPLGRPLWVFTVNRGQAIASFGIENKDNPIMEFEPANKAYQQTPLTGFRTFLKLRRGDQEALYEPFSPAEAAEPQRMAIGMNELELTAKSPRHGLTTRVLSFVVPGEPFAALARRVTLTNDGDDQLTLSVLDGLARLQPYGVDNWGLKAIGRTLEAWMAVFDLETGAPTFRLLASAADTAEVAAIEAGHFVLAYDETGRALPIVVDPVLVFAHNTVMDRPTRFADASLAELLAAPQITSGRTPCAFAAAEAVLAPGATLTLYSLVGHAGSRELLDAHRERLARPATFTGWLAAARALAEDLTDTVATRTRSPRFDAYCRQTFLDNVLRGGWPVLLGSGADRVVYHIYSRKHGDIERDYNDFFLAAEPYSQGNGNYRDINQNRRCDVLLRPAVGDHNVRVFMSLIQADGYNPLVVQGTTFKVPEARRASLLDHAEPADALAELLAGPFTPGGLLRRIADHQIALDRTPEAFLNRVLTESEPTLQAAHGEGFWIDHWTYNLDLIEAYLAVYPEREAELLWEKGDLPFYDSPARVLPRSRKTVLTERGPRQYGGVVEDEAKAAQIAARPERAHWVRAGHGRGPIAQTSLFVKLLLLATTRFAALDPAGMGVSMEAGKPGWYDALNGLPGLFGSAMNETYELRRLLAFLLAAVEARGRHTMRLPTELHGLLYTVATHLHNYQRSTHERRDFYYWDAVSSALERYRDDVFPGFDGREERLRLEDLAEILAQFLEKVDAGIARARAFHETVPITYFRFEATGYEILEDDDGKPLVDERGRPHVRVTGFRPEPLPLFLEGAVHALKIAPDTSAARAIHDGVWNSDLYDRPLKMVKVNASLAGESHEIGRARAFTPGWLENESIWLHMAYKYLLALLRAGLHDAFFAALRDGLIPFRDPAQYGRSPLENSSFLVSSAHPDRSLHGAGFVARLSGSTAEFLSLWSHMMAGPRPFRLQDGALCLQLEPALPGWLFTAEGTVRFTFLGQTTITYHNPSRQDTVGSGPRPARYRLRLADGQTVSLAGPVVGPPYAALIRSGEVGIIDVDLALPEAPHPSEEPGLPEVPT